jgi:hypothetical protein
MEPFARGEIKMAAKPAASREMQVFNLMASWRAGDDEDENFRIIIKVD